MSDQASETQGMFNRRAGRLSFFLRNLAGGVVIQILGFIMNSFDRPGMPPMGVGISLVLLTLIFATLFFVVVATIQRLNDLQRSRWLVLLSLVPLINIGFFFWCCFAKGVRIDES